MAKKKKRPPPPRSDAHLIERLREIAPDVLEAEIDFDSIVDAVLKQSEETAGPETKLDVARKK